MLSVDQIQRRRSLTELTYLHSGDGMEVGSFESFVQGSVFIVILVGLMNMKFLLRRE